MARTWHAPPSAAATLVCRLQALYGAVAGHRLEAVTAGVGVGVLVAGTLTALVAAAVPTGARVAGLATLGAAITVAFTSGGATRWRRRLHRRRQEHVGTRTAAVLDRLSSARWTVRHGVPVGEGRSAHLVADAEEVHLLVAVWLPRTAEHAALELRSALAAADRAAQHLAELDAARHLRRRTVPTVVAWGRHAASARDRQAPTCPVPVLLPGELWGWRAERGGSHPTAGASLPVGASA